MSMSIFYKIENFIFETKAWKLVFVIALLTLFKTGIWAIPNIGDLLLIAKNPFINPFHDQEASYLLGNWLGLFLAWLIGIKSIPQIFLFHLFFSIAFTLLFIKFVFNNFSNEIARTSLILFSILPVSAIGYFWVGYDSITLFIMLLSLFFPSRLIIISILGILLGMQHFELGFCAISGLLFAIIINHYRYDYVLKHTWQSCLCLLLGVITGKLILVGIFSYYSIDMPFGRLDWFLQYGSKYLCDFFFHFHYIIWSTLGLGWFNALKFTDWGVKSIPFFLILTGLCLLAMITADNTRVSAIATFPLVSVYWLLNSDFLKKISRKEIAFLFSTWALIPWHWTLNGIPKWSIFPYDIMCVFHYIFGYSIIPQNLNLTWPFQ